MTKKNVSQSPRILKIRQDRGYDCVYLGGKKIMLGRTGSPEADAAFRQLQIQALTDPTLAALKPEQVTVDNLCLAYLKYAKENDPDHFFGIKTAVEILLQHYAGQPVDTLDIRLNRHPAGNGRQFSGLLFALGKPRHGSVSPDLRTSGHVNSVTIRRV